MQHFRLFFFILCCLCFGLPAQAQDKSGLSFSERTGIKGISTFLHFNTVANDELFELNPFLNSQLSPKQAQEIEMAIATGALKKEQHASVIRKNQIRVGLRTELILAPWRQNPKSWKRNIEWSHGFSFQSVSSTLHLFQYERIDTMIYRTFERNHTFKLRQFNYQSNLYFHYPVAGSVMLYTGLGAGIGIPLDGNFESSDYNTYIHTRSGKEFEQTLMPAEVYNYEKFNTLLFSSLGLKVHISCRINIHAEYALIATQHYLNNDYILSDIRHGLNLGLRYKFNKPEPEEEGENPLERKPFW